MKLLIKSWYRKNWLAYFLAPASWLFRWLVAMRRSLYRLGIKKVTKFPVPIIIIGNITVGGNGKTPLVIWLADFLKKHGYSPGIISRGYGGHAPKYPYDVDENSLPEIAGEEAVLLARHTRCPVVVDPHRVAAVKHLLTTQDCNIVICDDGLQHYALARDIEIVAIDGKRRFGNGFCLPAGPLRESKARLKTVDFIIATQTFRPKRGEFQQTLQAGDIYNVKTHKKMPMHFFSDKKLHAVAGIGNPKRFFDTLRELGLKCVEHVFPDHHHFKESDLNFGEDAHILMTEKDAIKCQAFANDQYWCLPVSSQLSSHFGCLFLERLVAVNQANLNQ